MKQKKAFCLLLGKFPVYLDHLAPLAAELNIPLVITEYSIYLTAKQYYPNISILHAELFHLLSHFVPKYDIVISCLTPKLLRPIFSVVKDLEFYWIPHGISDKGSMNKGYFNSIDGEKNLLLYGKNLKEVIKKQFPVDETHVKYIKNYRYYHFLKNQDFYNEKLRTLDLKNKKPILLYAPSWNGKERGSSIHSASIVLEKLKKKFQIICKWHPDLLWQEAEKIKDLEHSYKDVCFLKKFPLVYPLLSITDIYVGDVSSIGYDFLTFQKPMLFLNEQGKNSPLFTCGLVLNKDEYHSIEFAVDRAISTHLEKYQTTQKMLYEYSFDTIGSVQSFTEYFQNLRQAILGYKNTPHGKETLV